MNILHLSIDMAQYHLDHGYASLEDAEEYAKLWNEFKLETRCFVVVKQKKPHKWATITVATPVLVLEPVE